jgi:hypothetical protein
MTNMWQVYTRPTSASDFFVHIFISYLDLSNIHTHNTYNVDVSVHNLQEKENKQFALGANGLLLYINFKDFPQENQQKLINFHCFSSLHRWQVCLCGCLGACVYPSNHFKLFDV